jgi:glutamate-5-semialdehyde dehydrogenase
MVKEKLENVKLLGCSKTCKLIDVERASIGDYYKEYNDLILAIKIVEDYKEAVTHINKYSTSHSESIISENKGAVEFFFQHVDSACLYHNASTRFTDGGCFGYKTEVGISTQKLHVRGPINLNALMTYKYIIRGNGEIR